MDFDSFSLQMRELQKREQKKQAKQERLQQKKMLIEEIKASFEKENIQHKQGSIEWAYAILNVNKVTSFTQIKQNYLQLAQKYHPDKNNGKYTQQMKDLNEAWEIIKNLSKNSGEF